MATIAHSSIVSADTHEPKHISDSTISDAGKVITPSGSGASELRNLTPVEVGITFSYGEISVEENTTPFAITAAVDSDLHTDSDYALLNSSRLTTSVEPELYGMTYDSVTNTLTTTVDGVYYLGGWFNVLSSANSSVVAIKYTIDGAIVGPHIVSDIKELGRIQNMSGFGLVTLSAGQAIGAAIACDKSASITIEEMRFNLNLIREL